MSSALSAFVDSFFSSQPVYNETAAPEPETQEEEAPPSEDDAKEDAPAEEADAPAEPEEEEEPEDLLPTLREECAATPACAPHNKHFAHCTETVNEGKGFKHEDCVEELFHLMHCVDNCVAPRLFSKLS